MMIPKPQRKLNFVKKYRMYITETPNLDTYKIYNQNIEETLKVQKGEKKMEENSVKIK